MLARFGGLSVGRCGAGEECATSDVQIRLLDPGRDDVQVWEDLLHTRLIGVAEVHHSHGELYIDSTGRCFGLSDVDDSFSFVGESFGEAVERLLLGRRDRPMLRPSQESVSLYGLEFTADHPDVYKY